MRVGEREGVTDLYGHGCPVQQRAYLRRWRPLYGQRREQHQHQWYRDRPRWWPGELPLVGRA